MTDARIALLFDIESMFLRARGDEGIRKRKPKNITLAITLALLHHAAAEGTIVRRFAALALPPPGRPWSSHIRREDWEIFTTIVDMGFDVSLITSEADAADALIEREANHLGRKTSDVDVIMVATNDGKPPFPKIVNNLRAAHKLVKIISYDSIPSFYKKFRHYPCTMIAWEVRELLTNHQEILEHLAMDPFAFNPLPLLREALGVGPPVRESSLNEKDASSIFPSTTRHLIPDAFKQSWRAYALTTLAAALSLEPPSRVYHIEDLRSILRNALETWPDPKPNREGIPHIVDFFIKTTDLFETTRRYVFNPQSSLLKE